MVLPYRGAVLERVLAKAFVSRPRRLVVQQTRPYRSLLGRTERARWRQAILAFALNPRQESPDQPLRCHLSQHSEPGRGYPL